MTDPQSPQARPTLVRYLVLASLCAAAAIAYLCRSSIGVAEESIGSELGIDDSQLGLLMGSFFLAYALFQIPGGWISTVWGSRRALTLVASVWSVATLLAGWAAGFASLLLLVFVAGVAQAGVFPASVDAISRWMPDSRRAFACGSLASFMSIGAVVSLSLTGYLIDGAGWSWRYVFAVFAAPGFLLAVWFFLWFRDRPAEHRAVNRAESALIESSTSTRSRPTADGEDAEPIRWLDLISLARSPGLWLVCGQQFCRAAGYIFYATWFPKFLKETRGVSTEESGYLSSLPVLGVVVGALAGGALVDWVWIRTRSRRWSRQGVAVVSLSVCAALILAAYFVETTSTAMALITIGSFAAALAGPCAYTATIDMGGRHVPTVFATMNMVGNIGAAVCPIAVERFVHFTGSWELVLPLFAVVYVGGAVCWGFLNPERSVVPKDEPGS